jgi:peptidoglycan/LPS O-acetylase OafA/YrhL
MSILERDTGGQIPIVEQLRGFAALWVAWFHFTNGHAHFLPDGLVKSSGAYGWVGVHIFFVVSGFVIPFAMHRREYIATKHYFRFLAKRLARLEPPYLACVVLTVLLAYLSCSVPGFRGQIPSYTSTQLLLHIGYLVAITSNDWVNPVFWSLAIEFQFYIAIALLFPLIAAGRTWLRFLSIATLVLLSFLPCSDILLLPYLGLFGLGMMTFQFRVGKMSRNGYLMATALLGATILLSDSAVVAGASLAAAWSIAFVRGPGLRSLTSLGMISYSLYLVHVPIGGRVINLAERLELTLYLRLAFLLAAVVVSVAAAGVYYRWLERPAKRWSSAIDYPPAETDGFRAPVHRPVISDHG